MEGTTLIVIGSLNTDIVASGVSRFPKPGEHVYGQEIAIGPGGKSRNIAAMAGVQLGNGKVAMIGRTAQDSFGLWRLPLDALQAAGVTTDFIRVMIAQETSKWPAIALIPVLTSGENQIFVLPGVSDDFAAADIDAADHLFTAVSANRGLLCSTLECPLPTVQYAVKKAKSLGLRVILDPGGIQPGMDIELLLKAGLYLLKPNEHEAKLITGVEVTDFESAKRAAAVMREMCAQNVLITHGDKGAYLFTETEEIHIKIDSSIQGSTKDATGCGDQTMATLCARLQQGKSLEEAARAAVVSGTLQFYKPGIQPVTPEELAKVGYNIQQ